MMSRKINNKSKAEPTHFSLPADLLVDSARLDLSAEFPILGVPIEIQTNSKTVNEIANRAFNAWCETEKPLVMDTKPMTLKIIVHQAETEEGHSRPYIYRVYDECLLSSGPGVLFKADRKIGTGLAFVTLDSTAQEQRFRRNVLECMALFLATRKDRVPIHASAVVRNNKAILLIGPSGSGKSTLSYALFGSGCQLLAEDAVYISLRSGLRLWGNPTEISLYPESKSIFPELSNLQEKVHPNGKVKISLDLTGKKNNHRLEYTFAGDIYLCFLKRIPNMETVLESFEPEQAKLSLFKNREQGFDIFNDIGAAIEQLVRHKAYILRVSPDVHKNTELIHDILE